MQKHYALKQFPILLSLFVQVCVVDSRSLVLVGAGARAFVGPEFYVDEHWFLRFDIAVRRRTIRYSAPACVRPDRRSSPTGITSFQTPCGPVDEHLVATCSWGQY